MSNYYAEALALIEKLAERWPACFSVYAARRKPLKVGIDADILASGIEGNLSAALRIYVGNSSYQAKLKLGAVRIDLNGEPAGVVTEYEAKGAAAFMAHRARRAAEKAKAAQPKPPEPPKRISLSDLRASALAKKAATSGAAK